MLRQAQRYALRQPSALSLASTSASKATAAFRHVLHERVS